MNSIFTAKYLQTLRNKKANKGFTLIELLVVVIIIGVLAAVALPNLLSQVGKARESEAKTGVGSVNRAQQTFHFERQLFATGTDVTAASNELGVVVSPEYYAFVVTGNAGTDADVSAIDADAANNGTRNYGGQITYAAGAYDTILCQSNAVGGAVTPDANADDCGADGAALN
jgi:prepilin-type N-terminal cleavage/methylation domain-containing protein